MVKQWRVVSVWQRFLLFIFVAILFTPQIIVGAQAAISQSFTTNDSVVPGAILSPDSTKKNTAQRASLKTADELLGVAGEGSLVELSSDGSEGKQVQVVTSGVTEVLVSDINGLVNFGDKITISPVHGVGMKAVKRGYVIGTAQAVFTDASSVTERKITDKNGNQRNVKIGLLPVQINISYYEPSENVSKSVLPAFLFDIANTIAGKDVSPVRVIAALIVLLAGVGAIAALLFSSVRSSIISIGRNPLAASAVHKSLFEVVLFAVGILSMMLAGVYLILAI